MKIKIRTILRFAAQSSLLPLVACSGTINNQTEEMPNVIFILADDLGYGDVSCMGQSKFRTPNIDRLGSEGICFTSHYAGSTVCAPSRSCLMTGQTTGHTPIRGNKGIQPEGQIPIPDSTLTVAEIFKANGYVTGAFGKWGLGGPATEGDPNRQGFDEFYGYNCQTLAHNYYTAYLWHNQEKVYLDGNKNGGTVQYSHDLIQEQALKFIEKNKDKPFFLYLPYTIPHAELIAPDDSIFERFKGKFPETPYVGVDSGPRYRKGGYCSQKYPRATFAAMVTRLDYSVEQVIDKLKELGLDNNTLVIFSSDNGPHLEGGADPDFFDSNGPLRGYKRDLYEGGIREPMLVRWPGKIQPGTRTDFVSAFWDFLPTICDILHVNVPKNCDGISMLPTLLGHPEQQKQHDYLYWEFHENIDKQAIRQGKWKAVRFGVNGPIELYDLNADLSETHDIAADHPEIIEKMKQLFTEAHTESAIWPMEVGQQ